MGNLDKSDAPTTRILGCCERARTIPSRKSRMLLSTKTRVRLRPGSPLGVSVPAMSVSLGYIGTTLEQTHSRGVGFELTNLRIADHPASVNCFTHRRCSGRAIRMLIERTDPFTTAQPDGRLVKLLIRARRS